MAAGKTLVGGTAYEITGGKTRRYGTNYTITGGKTLVGGTAYSISFIQIPTFNELMNSTNATITSTAGRNSSSTSSVSMSVGAGTTYYAFVFCNGEAGIYKLVAEGNAWQGTFPTFTLLKASDTSYAHLSTTNLTIYLSNNGGTSAASVYAGSIFLFTFSNYTEQQIDACLSGLTFTKIAGKNTSSNGAVSGTFTSGDNALVACNTYFSYNSPVGTAAIGNYSSYPSLTYVNGTTVSYATRSGRAQNAYGASIVKVS